MTRTHTRSSRWMAQALVVAIATGAVAVASCGSPSEDPDMDMASPEAAAPEPAAMANPLADTRWRLVEFQSMDDAIGTTRPDDPALYTMALGADGTASLVLNCNRATGNWTAEPGADGTSGRFEFGPLATTRALCPPPSMDEQIATQASYVRGYLLRDGRLNLSLMADGGIYVWEPLTDPEPAGQ